MAALAELHEPTRALRERARLALAVLGAPAEAWRVAGVTLLMALFVAVSGAFRVGGISPSLRYPLVVGLSLGLCGLGLGLAEAAHRVAALRSRPATRTAAVALTGWLAASLICWSLARAFEAGATPPFAAFAGPCGLMMLTIAALDMLTRRVVEKRRAPGAAAPFADRLPHHLRGAAILAVHGEDHFVRIHTVRGEHLVWMRLGDALEDLARLDGRQTHRSWWVARSAVTGVRRGNGRAVLTLSNGLKAPVSRRFAAELRADGWY